MDLIVFNFKVFLTPRPPTPNGLQGVLTCLRLAQKFRLARHPLAFRAAPGERRPREAGEAGRRRGDRSCRSSRHCRRLHRSLSPVHPPSSLPAAALPGRPTQHPRPSAHTRPHPCSPGPLPHEGPSAEGAAGGRRGKAKGRKEAGAGLRPPRSGCPGRGGRGSPPRARGRSAAAQEMPPPRLSSLSIQTVTAAASPPPGPAAAAAPRARRRPHPGSPRRCLRLASGRSPARSSGRRGSRNSEPLTPSPGGPKLRLTHGAAVDAPLLSSSGSRTDRHPLPPCATSPGAAQPADSPKAPTPIPRRSRRASLPCLRKLQQADSTGSHPPPAPSSIPRPLGRGFRAERRLPCISRDYRLPSPAASLRFEHDFISVSNVLLFGFSRHV
ncbi:uncharacterized protein LOC144578308 [Callithrix jacchus]